MAMMATKRTPLPAWLWAFAASYAAYASSSLHRLAGGDSGELLAEACIGGVAHPPGYPLLLLLLRVARAIGAALSPTTPFLVIANHLNALLAAGAAACVSHSLKLMSGYRVEAIAAGLLFAFAPLTWEYAIGLEVFALNNLQVGLILVCLVRHFLAAKLSTRNLCIGAFFCGLGLSNQHTIVLFETPMILAITFSTRLRCCDWLWLSLSFLCGLTPYIALYISAQRPTPGSWGDCSSPTGILTHVFRREYGTFRLSPREDASEGFSSRLAFYLSDLLTQFSTLPILCALWGFVSLLRHSQTRLLAGTLAVAFIFYLAVFTSLANIPLDDPVGREVTRRFFLQPNLIVSLWIGYGFAAIRSSLQRLPSTTTASLAVMMTALQFHSSQRVFTSSTTAIHDLIRDFGSAVLSALPTRNAVLLSYTDIQWNSVRYLQTCEGFRPDVKHLNLQLMAFPWFSRHHQLYDPLQFPTVLPDVSTMRASQAYATFLGRFLETNTRDHELFLDLHAVDESTISSDQLLFGRFQILPAGLVWRVTHDASSVAKRKLGQAWKNHLDSKRAVPLLVNAPENASISSGSWEFVAVSIAHDALYQSCLARLSYWFVRSSAIKDMKELEALMLGYEEVQRTLNDVVVKRVQQLEEGSPETEPRKKTISYEWYAVEKNAVVSRQRFQLYLDVLGGFKAADEEEVRISRSVLELANNRDTTRLVTIRQIEAFIPKMRVQHDEDVAAIEEGLARLRITHRERKTSFPQRRG